MNWMDGLDWMRVSLKFLFRGCTCPQGFFFAKKTFPEKMYFLKNRKIDFYEKILFCSKNHTRRSGMKFRVDPSAERLKLIWNRTSYDQKTFYVELQLLLVFNEFSSTEKLFYHLISSYIFLYKKKIFFLYKKKIFFFYKKKMFFLHKKIPCL